MAVFELAHFMSRRLVYLITNTSGVDDRVEQLVNEGRELRAKMSDVERSVDAAMRHQWVPLAEVEAWLKETDKALSKLDEFVNGYREWRGDLPGCAVFLLTCGFPMCSGYNFSVRAAELREIIEMLKRHGSGFEAVAVAPPFLPVERLPAPTLEIIGREETLGEIRGSLQDERVGVVGICGMGGVGKTALLKAVNNGLVDTGGDGCGFNVVMWATLSMDFRPETLQRDIARRCGLSLPQDERRRWAQSLFAFLSRRRFLLILDDVWAAFDLAEVGIPRPDTESVGSKILLSTRSDQVCSDMEAGKRIRVEPLDDDDSMALFESKAGVIPEDVRPYAEALVRACGGLPLALHCLGRVMARKRDAREWRWARSAMLESPEELRMEQVIATLKLSYDCGLSSDLQRRCLLRCSAMLADRHEMDAEELVDGLVEGGLVGYDQAEAARDRGYSVIGDLVESSLLRRRVDPEQHITWVAMHPMVRLMTSQIASDAGRRGGGGGAAAAAAYV